MTATRSAFSPVALDLLKKRYFLPGEDEEKLLDRVSFGNPKYRELMASHKFLPNSPTIFNAGTDQGSLSACFKFDVPDTMEGIMDVARKAALVLKFGGGVGYALSDLRPRGSTVHTTHKVASGPVGFLTIYHAVATAVTQAGKRDGAQMAILHCDHPDVKEFIHCKDNASKLDAIAAEYKESDPSLAEEIRGTILSTFNISVACTDEFMQNSIAQDEVAIPQADEGSLLMEMAESAWRTGDPGCYFIDTANKTNPTPWLGDLTGTNPCFTGDTRIWTLFGPMRFDELIGQDVPVLTDLNGKFVFRTMTNIAKTRSNIPVFRVRTVGNGKYKHEGEFRATGDHLVFLSDGTQRRVDQLQPKDSLASVYRYKANSKGYLKLRNSFGDEDMEHRIVAAWESDERPAYPEFHVDHINEDKTNNSPGNLRVLPRADHNALNMRGDRNPVRRFPERNIFARPGFSVGENNGMYGKSHSPETIEKLRKVNHKVISVEPVGSADVYDGTVEDTHSFYIMTEENGGVLVHNCGEVPLLNDEPCNLGSLNLSKFLMETFDDNRRMIQMPRRRFDWVELEKGVRTATRFLDDILDHNMFPDESITRAAYLTRKLGLGVMGWADALALMHIHYNSDEAVELASRVSEAINQWAFDESVKLGKEKGICPAFQSHEEEAYQLLAERGLFGKGLPRNATRTCIAPTGSISILLDASSGIEPHYALSYWHSTAGEITFPAVAQAQSEGFTPHITNEIDWRWHVRHQAAWQKNVDLAVSKTINMPNSATVDDIYNAYVEMWRSGCKGGTIFRDGSRGVQVLNAPKEEEVIVGVDFGRPFEKTFLDAIDTISVNSNIVFNPISDVATYAAIEHSNGRRRLPDERQAITHKFHVGGQEGYLTVGLYEDGTPGEVFITVNKEGSTVAGMCDSLGIMISIALQSGVSLATITRKLRHVAFEPSGMTGNKLIPVASSLVDYIAHWLEHKFLGEHQTLTYNHDEVKLGMQSGMTCPDCGGVLESAEGCLICRRCGWTRC